MKIPEQFRVTGYKMNRYILHWNLSAEKFSESVKKQIGHFCGQFNAGGAAADNNKGQ